MAEIILLPLKSLGPDQAERLCRDLVDKNANGAELGSRATHIRAGGLALMQLSSSLERALDQLEHSFSILGIKDTIIRSKIDNYMKTIMELSDSARSYNSNMSD